jgi:NADH-quinone oxidoreductase subunit A
LKTEAGPDLPPQFTVAAATCARMSFFYEESGTVPANYIPVVIFLIIAFLFPTVTLTLAKLVRPSSPGVAKLRPYECGIEPESDSRGRYTVRYYIIAILFVIFDIETIFLFPWAVQFKALGAFGLFEMGIFLAILIVAYVWVYKKGALDWI